MQLCAVDTWRSTDATCVAHPHILDPTLTQECLAGSGENIFASIVSSHFTISIYSQRSLIMFLERIPINTFL